MDSNDNIIKNHRDLEDFSLLKLKINGCLAKLMSGEYKCFLSFTDVTEGAPSINLFNYPNGTSAYLTNTAEGQTLLNNSELLIPKIDGKWKLPAAVFNTEGISTFLFEGKTQGKGTLTVQIYDENDKWIFNRPLLHLNLKDIKDMYEQYCIGNIKDKDWETINAMEPEDISTVCSLAGSGYTDSSPEEKDYILFVHGWRLKPWEKEAFADSSYKRLFWQGYNGRFGALQWPTEWSSKIKLPIDPRNYDRSERKAYTSAAGLHHLFRDLNGKYPDKVRVFAHSMGNIVVSEALKLEADYLWPPKAFEGSAEKIVHTYIASQAASVAQSYDKAIPSNLGGNPEAPNIYMEYPGVESPQPYDEVYFNDLRAAAGNIVNFYNPSDSALTDEIIGWPMVQWTKPDLYYDYDAVFYRYYYETLFGEREELQLPEDRYQIFAHIAQAYSNALGAQAGVRNVFTEEINLNNSDFAYNKEHSAQFESNYATRQLYWKTLLKKFGFIIEE